MNQDEALGYVLRRLLERTGAQCRQLTLSAFLAPLAFADKTQGKRPVIRLKPSPSGRPNEWVNAEEVILELPECKFVEFTKDGFTMDWS